MAKFTFKVGKDVEVREGDRVSIGTRSTASFTLADPLAADFHCDILVRGSEFVIMDRGGSLGTFVNGVRVVEAHPLKDGDQIVCAVTRLKVTIKGEELQVEQERGRFYYDDKKDGLDLSRREVAFGRFRPVSVGNWIVVFVMLMLFPLCYLGATSDFLLEPGDTWHGNQKAYHAAMENLDDDNQDCNACHDALSGTPATKCMNCHKDDIGPKDMHPFHKSAEDWGESCIKCHVDHRGTHEFALIAKPAKETCGDCHEADKKMTKKRPSTIPTVDVALLFNTFSHADHMDKEVSGSKIACDSCHKQYDSAAKDFVTEGNRPREYQPVAYEACMACHSGAQTDIKDLSGTWHGTDDGGKKCLQCHNELGQEAMTQVDFQQVTLGYSLVGRSHIEEMTSKAADGGKKCADCHRREDLLKGGADFAQRGFVHKTHILDEEPKDNAMKLLLSGSLTAPKKGQCSFCHADMMETDSLKGESPHHYANQSCATCHTSGGVSQENMSPPVASKRNDFPHKLHMKVDGGCYACHEFNGSDPKMDVVTPAKVKSCVACHSSHQNVGGSEGHCADCHKGAEEGRKKDPVYSQEAILWNRRPDASYSHNSPGHVGLTKAGKCTDCHGEDIWETKTVDAIKIPVEDDPRCRDCHLRERFHWR